MKDLESFKALLTQYTNIAFLPAITPTEFSKASTAGELKERINTETEYQLWFLPIALGDGQYSLLVDTGDAYFYVGDEAAAQRAVDLLEKTHDKGATAEARITHCSCYFNDELSLTAFISEICKLTPDARTPKLKKSREPNSIPGTTTTLEAPRVMLQTPGTPKPTDRRLSILLSMQDQHPPKRTRQAGSAISLESGLGDSPTSPDANAAFETNTSAFKDSTQCLKYSLATLGSLLLTLGDFIEERIDVLTQNSRIQAFIKIYQGLIPTASDQIIEKIQELNTQDTISNETVLTLMTDKMTPLFFNIISRVGYYLQFIQTLPTVQEDLIGDLARHIQETHTTLNTLRASITVPELKALAESIHAINEEIKKLSIQTVQVHQANSSIYEGTGESREITPRTPLTERRAIKDLLDLTSLNPEDINPHIQALKKAPKIIIATYQIDIRNFGILLMFPEENKLFYLGDEGSPQTLNAIARAYQDKFTTGLSDISQEHVRMKINDGLYMKLVQTIRKQASININADGFKFFIEGLDINTADYNPFDQSVVLFTPARPNRADASFLHSELATRLQQKVGNTRRDSDILAKEAEEQAKKLEQEITTLREQLSQTKKTLSEKEKTIARLEEDIRVLTQEKAPVHTPQLDANIEELKTEIQEKNNHITGLQEKLDNLQNRIEALTAENMLLNEQLAARASEAAGFSMLTSFAGQPGRINVFQSALDISAIGNFSFAQGRGADATASTPRFRQPKAAEPIISAAPFSQESKHLQRQEDILTAALGLSAQLGELVFFVTAIANLTYEKEGKICQIDQALVNLTTIPDLATRLEKDETLSRYLTVEQQEQVKQSKKPSSKSFFGSAKATPTTQSPETTKQGLRFLDAMRADFASRLSLDSVIKHVKELQLLTELFIATHKDFEANVSMLKRVTSEIKKQTETSQDEASISTDEDRPLTTKKITEKTLAEQYKSLTLQFCTLCSKTQEFFTSVEKEMQFHRLVYIANANLTRHALATNLIASLCATFKLENDASNTIPEPSENKAPTVVFDMVNQELLTGLQESCTRTLAATDKPWIAEVSSLNNKAKEAQDLINRLSNIKEFMVGSGETSALNIKATVNRAIEANGKKHMLYAIIESTHALEKAMITTLGHSCASSSITERFLDDKKDDLLRNTKLTGTLNESEIGSLMKLLIEKIPFFIDGGPLFTEICAGLNELSTQCKQAAASANSSRVSNPKN